jgi:hypothetical protein
MYDIKRFKGRKVFLLMLLSTYKLNMYNEGNKTGNAELFLI